jgi:hypothetical protein
MNLSQYSGSLALVAYTNLYDGATFTIYSGTQPASPETALSGNTALVTFTFSTPGFSGVPTTSGGFDKLVASFTSNTANPGNSGTASFGRAVFVTNTWTGSHAYARGAIVSNSSNYYVCTVGGTSAGSGGPTSQAYGIVDGTVGWDFISTTASVGSTVLADYTVGTTSGFDAQIGNTTVQIGTSVTITSFQLQIPVV